MTYLITWTTYGTWLPGEERGWVDHHTFGPGQPIRQADPKLRTWAKRQLKSGPLQLDRDQRKLVQATVCDHCRIRQWTLHAINVRSNHVHVVVGAQASPERVMTQLKAWCSRRLNEQTSNHVVKWWTRHGSTRYLHTEHSVLAAIDYVLNWQ